MRKIILSFLIFLFFGLSQSYAYNGETSIFWVTITNTWSNVNIDIIKKSDSSIYTSFTNVSDYIIKATDNGGILYCYSVNNLDTQYNNVCWKIFLYSGTYYQISYSNLSNTNNPLRIDDNSKLIDTDINIYLPYYETAKPHRYLLYTYNSYQTGSNPDSVVCENGCGSYGTAWTKISDLWKINLLTVDPGYNYWSLECSFEEKYNGFFSYVNINFFWQGINEAVPGYVPELSRIFMLTRSWSTLLFTGLVGFDDLTWSFDRNNIYWSSWGLTITSRAEILKYNFMGFSWGENLNQEIGGYSDRYTHFAISTGTGTFFNYLQVDWNWIWWSTSKNNFIVEYADINQANIVSIKKLMNFWEKIHLPSLTRRVNIYFKDWTKFDLDKISLWQAGICEKNSSGDYIPTITSELTATEPADNLWDTGSTNLYIEDNGLNNTTYYRAPSDVVFFPADWTIWQNELTTPEACINWTWSESFGCVHGWWNELLVKIKNGVDNVTWFFTELLKLDPFGSDESFFTFIGISYAASGDNTRITTAFVGRLDTFAADDTSFGGKLTKFLYWGFMLVAIILAIKIAFKKE